MAKKQHVCQNCQACRGEKVKRGVLRTSLARTTVGLSEVAYGSLDKCEMCKHPKSRHEVIHTGIAQQPMQIVVQALPPPYYPPPQQPAPQPLSSYPSPAPPPQPTPTHRMAECPRCGADVRPEMRKCPYCSRALTES